jgi:thioesterase domain-containing protein/acyl carrier protein
LNDQLQPIESIVQEDRLTAADATLVAEKVRRIFREIFATEAGEDDDFFDLGGDSLTGETLLSAIERDFGVSLPLSILLEKSTPRALAGTVAVKMTSALPTILFAVRVGGSSTPLFCIHGLNGTAGYSRKLRNVLPDRPIYAVRALGLLPGEVPLVSVPDMARSYIREIRRVRPSGPYHIFGQCHTANVAYEVAQQLSAAGEQVNTLTLGDPKRLRRRSRIRRFYYWLTEKRLLRTARRFPEMSGDERWRKVVKPALVAATNVYEAGPYSGRTMVVAASINADEILHPKRGYPALVPQLETVVIEGTHHDVFTGMDGGVQGKLARAMSSFLARHD